MSRRLHILPLAVAVLATGVLAGCGGSGSSSGGGGYGYRAPAKSTTTGATTAATVGTASGAPGTFLVDGKGMTLYLFEKDTGATSMCTGACATAWPPLLTKGAPTAMDSVQAADLGTTKRPDGTTQVTYGGHPLYRYAGDTATGQTGGQGSKAFGGAWYVVSPSGKAIDPS